MRIYGLRLTILFCLLVLISSACMSKTDNIKVNQERGYRIIQAITQYKKEQGQFPAQLDTLVPTYLPEIPRTVTGGKFIYQLDEPRGYYLIFRVDYFDVVSVGGASCAYTDRFEMWDCSPGSPEDY